MTKLKSNDKPFFFGARPNIFGKAKELRSRMTPAEIILWDKVRNKQILGLRFRRQHPISQFIVDFYCHQARLVIEIDGDIHQLPEVKERDDGRTFELEKFGLKVIRFKNDEVINNLPKVIYEITDLCKKKLIEPLP